VRGKEESSGGDEDSAESRETLEIRLLSAWSDHHEESENLNERGDHDHEWPWSQLYMASIIGGSGRVSQRA
jgi:hypothetical protein